MSITFYYCTVICNVLRPINVIFLKRQHKLYLIFCVSIFLKVGKFAICSERPKAKTVFRPPDPLTRGSASGHRWGLRPHTPYYRGLTLVFVGGGSNSLTPALTSLKPIDKLYA